MRIAINTRLLLEGKMDGIGWFTFETVKRMVQAHPEHEFFFFFDRQPSNIFLFANNIHPVILYPQARHPVLWYLFFEWSITRALKKYRIDLFLSPDGWMSLRTNVPTLTVIHDLNFEHSTDYLRPSHQRYMTYFFPKFAKKATRIATVSQFSKDDIAETYSISHEKIDVVYDGAHTDYKPISSSEKAFVQNKYSGGNPYFIFIGTISKRKNLTNTLLAFDIFKESDTQNYKFLVVGSRFWWGEELEHAYSNMQHKDDVIFLGRAESNVLSQLLGASEALLYVSLFEGFGIPIIEAFQAEIPVISSNCTSIPEVAGDAALLVNPNEPSEIASAMTKILTHPEMVQNLVAKGRVQRELYSWDRTANLLWNSLMKTAETAHIIQ